LITPTVASASNECPETYSQAKPIIIVTLLLKTQFACDILDQWNAVAQHHAFHQHCTLNPFLPLHQQISKLLKSHTFPHTNPSNVSIEFHTAQCIHDPSMQWVDAVQRTPAEMPSTIPLSVKSLYRCFTPDLPVPVSYVLHLQVT